MALAEGLPPATTRHATRVLAGGVGHLVPRATPTLVATLEAAVSDRFGEAVIYWTARKNRWRRAAADGTAQPFQPGERVRGAYDLATVLSVDAAGRVQVRFDEVDAEGFRRPDPAERTVWREPWTLTRVPRDTPMAQESELSRRYWSRPGAK